MDGREPEKFEAGEKIFVRVKQEKETGEKSSKVEKTGEKIIVRLKQDKETGEKNHRQSETGEKVIVTVKQVVTH